MNSKYLFLYCLYCLIDQLHTFETNKVHKINLSKYAMVKEDFSNQLFTIYLLLFPWQTQISLSLLRQWVYTTPIQLQTWLNLRKTVEIRDKKNKFGPNSNFLNKIRMNSLLNSYANTENLIKDVHRSSFSVQLPINCLFLHPPEVRTLLPVLLQWGSRVPGVYYSQSAC